MTGVQTCALPILLLAGVAWPADQALPHRWVYLSRGLRSDQDVEDIRQIARTAAENGLTGILLAARLDTVDLQPPEYFGRLESWVIRLVPVKPNGTFQVLPRTSDVPGILEMKDLLLGAGPAADTIARRLAKRGIGRCPFHTFPHRYEPRLRNVQNGSCRSWQHQPPAVSAFRVGGR